MDSVIVTESAHEAVDGEPVWRVAENVQYLAATHPGGDEGNGGIHAHLDAICPWEQQFFDGGFRGAAFAGAGEHLHQVFHRGGEPRLLEQVAQGGCRAFMHRTIALAVAGEKPFKEGLVLTSSK